MKGHAQKDTGTVDELGIDEEVWDNDHWRFEKPLDVQTSDDIRPTPSISLRPRRGGV